ncbi:hypothetical protein IU367_12150 [Aeromonas bestiarum]|uniref:hypothetical protein n=1 Tax=Aeromonas bestiarum TaxID=105751 RepID=UPI002379C999|nr:hypothetical protein [Aeromonas bestiarum]WDL80851.1 hypothetical protein IU367_12150 [Aeromonas bestiarum]
MSWTQGALRWPASAASLQANAQGVLAQIPATQTSAMARLQSVAERAQYPRSPLSEAATALAGLRAELDQLLVTGRCLTVTPYQHGVGQQQGQQFSLAAPNAVATLAAKLQDGADPLLPSGQLHALAWLVTGNSAEELARQLAILCALLPLPEWCATLRRLHANNDTMSQPTAAKVPRWRADEPLSWAPLRPARMVLGAELAQLESLARDSQTPIAKLQGLATRRTARLAQLAETLAKLGTLSGTLWHWQGQGDTASLATQLGQSSPPDHSQSMTVGALLLSPSPLTFWQELTP